MKRYKSSDLSRNVAEVIKEAKTNGVIIECRNTNGEVVDELVLKKCYKCDYCKGQQIYQKVLHGGLSGLPTSCPKCGANPTATGGNY